MRGRLKFKPCDHHLRKQTAVGQSHESFSAVRKYMKGLDPAG